MSTLALRRSLLALSVPLLGGCAVASVAGAAVSVAGSVVSAGVGVAGKVVEAGIDMATPSKKKD
jgi:uncharacterized membrane protein